MYRPGLFFLTTVRLGSRFRYLDRLSLIAIDDAEDQMRHAVLTAFAIAFLAGTAQAAEFESCAMTGPMRPTSIEDARANSDCEKKVSGQDTINDCALYRFVLPQATLTDAYNRFRRLRSLSGLCRTVRRQTSRRVSSDHRPHGAPIGRHPARSTLTVSKAAACSR